MPYSDEERTDFLLGQITALSAFAQAVLLTYPNRAALLAKFEAQLLRAEANSLSTQVTDAHLDGIRSVQSGLYPPDSTQKES